MTKVEETLSRRTSGQLFERARRFLLAESGVDPKWAVRFSPLAHCHLRDAERLICEATRLFDVTMSADPSRRAAALTLLVTSVRLLEKVALPSERDKLSAAIREGLENEGAAAHFLTSTGETETETPLTASGCKAAADSLLNVIRNLVGNRKGFWPLGLARLVAALCLFLGLCVLVVAGVARAFEPVNYLAGVEPRRSSDFLYWPVKDMAFHTDNDPSPFVTYRLERPRRITRLRIRNIDNFRERALPLVVELSEDGDVFREVARRTDPFTTWRPSFAPRTAKLVRIRVDRPSWLHLKVVEAYGND